MSATEETTTEWDDDLEAMAEARLEIEEELTERQDELAQIGTFDTARCTSFDRVYMHRFHTYRQLDDPDHPQAETKVSFEFTFPDGTTTSRSFRIENEPRTIQSFLDAHGADSVTDMVGAEHACHYTQDGWALCNRQSVRPRWWYPMVSEDGSLTQANIFGWGIAAGIILTPVFVPILLTIMDYATIDGAVFGFMLTIPIMMMLFALPKTSPSARRLLLDP